MNTNKKPTLLDYLAAGIVANFIVTVWSMTPNDYIYYILSLPIYTIAGAISTYLVCTRASESFLGIGVKSSIISWLSVIIFTNVSALNITFEFILTILITFILGSIVIAYYKQRQKIKKSISDYLTENISENNQNKSK